MDEDSGNNDPRETLNSLLSDVRMLGGANSEKTDITAASGVTAETLDAILMEKLSSNGADGDVRWSFVKRSMETLMKLRRALETETAAASVGTVLLSVKNEAEVSSLVQMVVVLGVLPSLIPGVGLPMEQRSNWVQRCMGSESTGGVDKIEENHRRLVSATRALIDLLDQVRLANVVLSKHLGDVLAALIQLGYAPLAKPKEDDTIADDGKFVMTQDKYDVLSKEQTYFRGQMLKVLDRVYQPLVIKYLLLIQTGGGVVTKSNGGGGAGASPMWLQRVCGDLLSSRLMQENGVLNVMRGVLDIGGFSDDGPEQTKKYEVIAGVLAKPPASAYKDTEFYYSLICPQILSILALKDESEAKQFHMIACACVRSISDRSLILSRRYMLDVMMGPLLRCCDATQPSVGEIVSEEDLEHCLLTLHKVFVIGNDPSPATLIHLEPVVLTLLELHCQITFGISFLKRQVKELLQRYLKCCTNSHTITAIRALAFKRFEEGVPEVQNRRLRLPRSDLRFVDGGAGGVKAMAIEDGSNGEERRFYVDDDEKAIVLVDLMQETKDKSLAVGFFMALLRDLSTLMSSMQDDPNVVDRAAADALQEAAPVARSSSEMERKLLEFEKDLDDTMAKLRKNLMVIRLLGLLSEDEKLQEELMKDSAQLLDFICITLSRGAELCRHRKRKRDSRQSCKSERAMDEEEEDEEYGSLMLEVQSLNTALTLLSFKVTKPDVSLEEWARMQEAIADLTDLAELHSDEKIRLLSKRLAKLIATHGIVLESTSKVRTACKDLNDRAEQIHKLAEKLKMLGTEADGEGDSRSKTRLASALELLGDPLLPVRGHGLIELTKLVDEKDDETVKSIKKVVDAFKTNLEDDDSYIYLQSINGLVACASLSPDFVISLLTREFAQIDDRKSVGGGDKAVELRTKIGEALVKVTMGLGEVTPKYRNDLINPFFGQLSHPDELVRCSALSNIGEVCKNLRFSLGGIVEELFNWLHQAIEFDKSIEVRRAAVMVIKLLLEGMGKDAFRVLEKNLRDVWRALVRLRNTETDAAMLAHVGGAIEEIDKIVREFFLPQAARAEMKKNIYVLDAPPDPY